MFDLPERLPIAAAVVLTCLCSGAARAQEESPPEKSALVLPAPPAELEVLRGRVVLVDTDGVRSLMRFDGKSQVAGAAHLEVAAGGEARIAWSGRSSLRLIGPASLQWEAAPRRSGDALEWTFFSAESAHVEVRRGRLLVRLPNGWHGSFAKSAFALETVVGGAARVRLDAGETPALTWMGDASRARPPVLLAPGESARLIPGRDLPTPIDHTARARPWSAGAHWPWPRTQTVVVPGPPRGAVDVTLVETETRPAVEPAPSAPAAQDEATARDGENPKDGAPQAPSSPDAAHDADDATAGGTSTPPEAVESSGTD